MNGVAVGDGEHILWVPGNEIIEPGILSAWRGLEIQKPAHGGPSQKLTTTAYDYSTTIVRPGGQIFFGNLAPGIDHQN